jgi:hypothetical protein
MKSTSFIGSRDTGGAWRRRRAPAVKGLWPWMFCLALPVGADDRSLARQVAIGAAFAGDTIAQAGEGLAAQHSVLPSHQIRHYCDRRRGIGICGTATAERAPFDLGAQ